MKLNIRERYVLVKVMPVPERADFEVYSTIESLNSKFYPSPEEVKEFEIKTEDGQIKWNDKGSEPVEIELAEHELQYIKDFLNEINGKKELTPDLFYLMKKFKD